MQNEMRGIRNPRGQVGFVADMKERNYMQPVSSFASIFWRTLSSRLRIKKTYSVSSFFESKNVLQKRFLNLQVE